MARVLVAYATVEGQTRKIAAFIADHLKKRGDEPELLDLTVRAAVGRLNLSAFDAVILAAPVHTRLHHAAALRFARRYCRELRARPCAFVSVSLHALGRDAEEGEEARGYADQFVAETGWMPHAVHEAAGALRYSEYDFFKRWVMRSYAREHAITVDPHGDLEFTDWDALAAFIDAFMTSHAPGS